MRGSRAFLLSHLFSKKLPLALLIVIPLAGCPGQTQVKPERKAAIPAIPSSAPRPQAEDPIEQDTAEQALATVTSGNEAVREETDPTSKLCNGCAIDSALGTFPPAAGGALNEELLNRLVDQAFAADDACQKVFTGNKGNYTSAPTQGYARSFAKSFAQDVCSPVHEEVYRVQSAGPGSTATDALARGAFSKYLGPYSKPGSIENLSATYRMSYALSFRESSGNFQEGRDESANNKTYETEEAGAFQVSANTLNFSNTDPEGVRARRRIFVHYLDVLSEANTANNPAALAQVCDLRNKSELPPGNRELDSNRDYLFNSMFSKGQPCERLQSAVQGDPEKLSTVNFYRGTCFMHLQKRCPSFAIKYNTATIRTRANHFGPLKVRSDGRNYDGKPPPRPECRGIFDVVIQNREAICGNSAETANPAPAETASPPGSEPGVATARGLGSAPRAIPVAVREEDGGLPKGSPRDAEPILPFSGLTSPNGGVGSPKVPGISGSKAPSGQTSAESPTFSGASKNLPIIDNREMPGVSRSYGGRGRRSKDDIKYIKVDTSAATQSGQELARASNIKNHPFGYHFIIDQDGTIRQTADVEQITQGLASSSRTSFFRGALNANTIHISLAGTDNDRGGGKPYISSKPFGTLPSTEAQQAALKKLYQELTQQMPQLKGQVFGHGEVSTNRHRDEGRAEARMLRDLAE